MGRLLRVEGLLPVTAAVAFLLLFGLLGGAGDPSPAAPWVGLGVLVAPAIMGYAHRGAAAWAAGLAAVVWTSLAHTASAALVAWAYALVAIAITRRDRSPVAAPVPRRQPPAPAGLPQVAVPAEVAGLSLLTLAMAGFVATLLGYAGTPWLTAVIAVFGLGSSPSTWPSPAGPTRTSRTPAPRRCTASRARAAGAPWRSRAASMCRSGRSAR
jgi:hypothetical protein